MKLPNFLNFDPLNALRQIAQAELNKTYNPNISVSSIAMKLLE